jgi:hypothetical protein
MRWMLLCAAALLAACGEPESKETNEPCKEPWRDQQVECLIHADLQAIVKRLQPPKPVPPKCPAYDPDEVCDGECEAARGAAAEYERKYKATCDLAVAMCLEMQGLGHWQDQDCTAACLFFGDKPAERGGKP